MGGSRQTACGFRIGVCLRRPVLGMAQRLTGLASFHWLLDVAPEKLVCKSFEAHGLLHKPGSWLQNPESSYCRPGQVQGQLVSPSPYSPCRPGGLALAGGSRLQHAEQGSLLTASSAQLPTCCLVPPHTHPLSAPWGL